MKKIKWGNVIKLIILVLSGYLVLHDMFMLVFKFATFTWFGLITFIGALFLISAILEDFNEQTKNIPSDRSKTR